MLKLAVIGAQSLLGRELVNALEAREASVVPLSTGPLTVEEEIGDLVVFAPTPLLLEGLDAVILADTPDPALLADFPGRILDLRSEPEAKTDPMPLAGAWPKDARALRSRPALEQVLALLPSLLEGLGDVGGTHLRSVAWMGDQGLDGLVEQTLAVLNGEDPDLAKLGYRQAFEVVPVTPPAGKGRLMEVRVPSFHGDLLILQIRAAEGKSLVKKEAPAGVKWVDAAPSSRDVAVSADLLAHMDLAGDNKAAMLTLGFDPVLWGVLRPTLRVLGLM
ncbi:hypothetical protein GETHLI_17500 [Geothrix limicola]|uniref:Uncharacterized protein n=1 Tax=Geothrix limicola TaxID=2927978 RepID=A0ABQ5QFA8_9BACT|nr:hypothetical protein [Geothrix limicola]GLH73248.1 hypothetical protein GETHLI_17500 [Geothrix limicola]